jgi:hypothetical protein
MPMEHWWNDNDRGGPKYSEINLFQGHFVHYKSHMEERGIESGPPLWEAGQYVPETWHGLSTRKVTER